MAKNMAKSDFAILFSENFAEWVEQTDKFQGSINIFI